MVVYAVLSHQEKVDNDLMKIKIRNRKHFHYILFRESLPETKVCALHINEMNNIETRFQSLFNAKIGDRIKMNGNIGSLQDIILDIKVNKAPLFVGVE